MFALLLSVKEMEKLPHSFSFICTMNFFRKNFQLHRVSEEELHRARDRQHGNVVPADTAEMPEIAGRDARTLAIRSECKR